MADYITAEEYTAWTGETPPADLDRKEFTAVELFKAGLTRVFPTPTELAEHYGTVHQTLIKRAIIEQIVWFNNDIDAYQGHSQTGGGFSIGGYSETANQGKPVNINNFLKRIAPNAYTFLSNVNLTYRGVFNSELYRYNHANEFLPVRGGY